MPTISLILVLGIMSLLVLLTAFLKHLISQVVILHSRGLVIVQVWHWYVSVGRKMEFMILLFVSIGTSLAITSFIFQNEHSSPESVTFPLNKCQLYQLHHLELE